MTLADPRPLSDEIVDEIIARHPERTGDLLGILEEAQQCHPQKYLPAQTYAYVAQKTGIPRSQVMSVVTFYAFFNRRPQGRHTLTVCRGTACHTRGSRRLYAALMTQLGAVDKDVSEVSGRDDTATSATSFTTADGRLTIRTVACFGQCAQAPVAASDEVIHGYVSEALLRQLVDRIGDDGPAETTGPSASAPQEPAP